MPSPSPLCTPANTTPSCHLYWVLDLLWRAPPEEDSWLPPLTAAVCPQGIRILNRCQE